jgi:hypothetical protein
LPCVFQAGARQRAHVCRVFCSRRTAKGVTRRLAPVPSVAFLPCVVQKRTAKIVYRALSDVAHGKGALPCKMLPCAGSIRLCFMINSICSQRFKIFEKHLMYKLLM